MRAILSADLNWAIGCDGKLLARVPEDMKFFKSTTLGKVVIMGRKTFDSLPKKPLSNRVNIVLTRDKSFEHEGVIVLHNLEEALKEIKMYMEDEIYIIGGEEIYKLFLPYCTSVYVTKWMEEFDADTFFPNLDADINWEMVSSSEEKEHKGIKFKFTEYKNRFVEVIK
jgi:dihydrofolate reductase